MVEGVVVNIDQNITKQRWKKLYIISDYKNTDVSVKRARLNMKSVVSVTVLVPVSVNTPNNASLWTSTTTTIVTSNPPTSVPTNPSTNVDPESVKITTTTTLETALSTNY